MRMGKKIVSVLLTAALITGCALLPTMVARWQDHRQIGRIKSESIEPIALREGDSSLIDRLRLCSQNQLYCEVQEMSIGTGVRFQEDTVIEQARAQLDLLHEADILTAGADGYTDAQVAGVEFLADPGDPSNNAMVWILAFYTETGATEVLIDDESGLIVALNATDMEAPSPADDPDACGAAWASYLGLTRVETERKGTGDTVMTVAKAGNEKYTIAEEGNENLRWTYGSVTLTNTADPNGYQVIYLIRMSSDSLWITVA